MSCEKNLVVSVSVLMRGQNPEMIVSVTSRQFRARD